MRRKGNLRSGRDNWRKSSVWVIGLGFAVAPHGVEIVNHGTVQRLRQGWLRALRSDTILIIMEHVVEVIAETDNQESMGQKRWY